MRQSILWRFLSAYLIFLLFGIIIINYYTTSKSYQRVTLEDATTLYNTATTVTDFVTSCDSIEDSADYRPNLDKLSLKDNTSIIITDVSGKVLYTKGMKAIASIPNFSLESFDGHKYDIGHFFGLFDTSMLSVYQPILFDGEVVGYVFINESTSYLTYNTVENVHIFYVTYFIILISSSILIFSFLLYVYKPLKDIRKATSEYAQGNFSYNKLKIGTNDEMGDISSSLIYMANQLNNSEEYQKKFISNISHDFRSPLTSIKGYVEAIIDGTIPVELQNKYLNIVLSETSRLEKLTNGLINLNNWGGQNQGLIYEDFDLDIIIKGVMETFEGQGRKKDVNITLESRHPHLVHADKSKIQQVLYNLIDNAMKFSPKDSTIKVSLFTKADRIYCSIKDSGVGISNLEITKIWDRFYKTDSSRGKDKTGSGIGLSIVKEIINAHQQTIDVISTEGIGTEFIFSLDKSKKKSKSSETKTQ